MHHWEIAYRRGATGQLDSRLAIVIIWMIEPEPCSTSSQVYLSFWLQRNYRANKPNIADHLHDNDGDDDNHNDDNDDDDDENENENNPWRY